MGHCSAAAGRAVSGVVAAPLVLSAEIGAAFDRKIWKIGLIGLGQRGLQWADTLAGSSHFELVSWFDPNQAAAHRASIRLQKRGHKPVEPAGSESLLLHNPNIDAVLIASPSFAHAAQIEQAIRLGKHVLTEKPIALNDAGTTHLAALVEKSADHVFMVANSKRRHSGRQAMLDWLKTEPLGPLVDIQVNWTHPQGPPQGQDGWLTDPALSGDWLAEHGDHIWDLLAEISPTMPEVVDVTRHGRASATSLLWKVALKWPNGASCSVRHSMLPGTNFQSPGLSFLLQYETGMVDLISGRITSTTTIPAGVPHFPRESDELSDTLMVFSDRLHSLKNPELTTAANRRESERAVQVARFRHQIQNRLQSV